MGSAVASSAGTGLVCRKDFDHMAVEVLDIVALLPARLHRTALALSARLADRMAAQRFPSHFRLGAPFGPGPGGPCEPHVSIFMLAVDDGDIDDVVRVTRRLAADLPALIAEGIHYRHNPVGAPELYFQKNAQWVDVQRTVIAEVEPFRRGRLRTFDPAGARIQDLLSDPREDRVRRSQLIRFGFDEVTEHWDPETTRPDDRFNPHVTLAWPVDPASRIDLTGLPPAREFSAMLTELAVYGMSPYGTCTTPYGTAPLNMDFGAAPDLARQVQGADLRT
jgi:hypothetical protein